MSAKTGTHQKHLLYQLPTMVQGIPVEELEDYNPDGHYLHALTKGSPGIDDAILNGARVIAKCGVKWTPKATDFPAPGAAVTIPWCPLCILLHGYQGRGTR